VPQDFVESQLPAGVKAELRGLPKELAEIVGAHIWAAGRYVDVDPDLAFRHAEAARRRAGRLPIVREAAAETAYAAGEFAVALREFRAIRRLSGGDELIPVIADCERALGRPRDALEVLGELSPTTKDVWLRIECLLVEAGVRADLGQRAEAKRLLQAAISRRVGPPFGQARLRYAYANLLEEDGDLAGAREWFTSAAALDENAELDISDRLATLDGVVLPDFLDEDEDEEEDEPIAEEADESMADEADESTDAEAGEPIDDEGDEPTDDEADEDDESDVEAEAEPDDDSDGLPADDDEHDEDAERAFDAQAPDSDEEQH